MTPASTALTLRTSDFVHSGLDDRSLRRLHESGGLTRVVRGAYVRADAWASMSARDRYLMRIHATVERLTTPVCISHWSAAAVWGFAVPDEWPVDVQVIDSSREKSNRIATLHRRPGLLRADDVTLWEALRVTTPARTAADLALASPFEAAVLVFDSGLHANAFDKASVTEHLDLRPDARRRRSARKALDFADAGSASAGESFSRLGMAARGVPPPVLQQPFFDERGKIGDVDFWWPDFGLVGEFDGMVKYSDPAYLRGRTPAQVIADEKGRQARLQAHPRVRLVVRWDYPVARKPDELARRLLAAGLPRQSRQRGGQASQGALNGK